jgi:hypothetical protein
MYGRSNGNVRELIVSENKEPPTGTAGYKSTGPSPSSEGGKEANTRKWRQHENEGQFTSTVKRRETKQDGKDHE